MHLHMENTWTQTYVGGGGGGGVSVHDNARSHFPVDVGMYEGMLTLLRDHLIKFW